MNGLLIRINLKKNAVFFCIILWSLRISPSKDPSCSLSLYEKPGAQVGQHRILQQFVSHKMSEAFLFLFRIFVVSSGSKYQLMISWWISLVIMSTSNPVSLVHIPKILTGANRLAKPPPPPPPPPPPRGLDRIINRPTLSPLLEPEKTAEIWHQKAELGNVMKCSINTCMYTYACIHKYNCMCVYIYIYIYTCCFFLTPFLSDIFQTSNSFAP